MVNILADGADKQRPAKTLKMLPPHLKDVKFGCDNVRIVDFGDLSTMKRYMLEKTKVKHPKSNTSMKEGEWAGTDSWEAYMELLDKGDDNVIEKIRVETGIKVAELSKKYREVIANYKFDVTGQFFDVGLVVTGVPEAWLEPEIDIDEGEDLAVEICINGAFHGGFDQKKIIDASARVLAIAKILEDNGVQVALKLVSANTRWCEGRDEDLLVTIDLKAYDAPINYKKLSAILTVAYHRRAMFKVMEMQKDDSNPNNYGYGYPYNIEGFVSLNNTLSIDKLEKRLFKKGE